MILWFSSLHFASIRTLTKASYFHAMFLLLYLLKILWDWQRNLPLYLLWLELQHLECSWESLFFQCFIQGIQIFLFKLRAILGFLFSLLHRKNERATAKFSAEYQRNEESGIFPRLYKWSLWFLNFQNLKNETSFLS